MVVEQCTELVTPGGSYRLWSMAQLIKRLVLSRRRRRKPVRRPVLHTHPPAHIIISPRTSKIHAYTSPYQEPLWLSLLSIRSPISRSIRL